MFELEEDGRVLVSGELFSWLLGVEERVSSSIASSGLMSAAEGDFGFSSVVIVLY